MRRFIRVAAMWLPLLMVSAAWIMSYRLPLRWIPLARGWRAIVVEGTLLLHNPTPLRPGNIFWRRFGIAVLQQDPHIWNSPPAELTDPVPMYLVPPSAQVRYARLSATSVPGATVTRVMMTGLVVLVPLWIPFAVAGVWPMLTGMRLLLRRRRQKLGLCVECQYDLTGNTSGVCPECGTAVLADSASPECGERI